jgi:putative ABC transport system permease protein
MWRLLLKNLARNKRRTLLTGASMAVSLFLLASLAMVYTALGRPYQNATSPRMMVRRSIGITFALPESYGRRIKMVPGVAALTPMNWFGAYWVDRQNSFANFAIDANTVFDVLNNTQIPPDQLEAFKREQVAAVAGRKTAEKYHWKVGDRITLLGSPYGFAPELILRGIFSGGPDDMFFFHWDYLNESIGRRGIVGLYWIRLDRPESASQVADAIDGMFRNTNAETRTESESSFLLGFISMLGNVRRLMLMIGGAVAFAVLLILANSVAMSIRERVAEAAVMRVLGFRATQILSLFVGEAMTLSLVAALVGVGGAKLLYDVLGMTRIGPLVWADLRLRPETLAFSFLLSALIALLASALPAYHAVKVKLADALRYTG